MVPSAQQPAPAFSFDPAAVAPSSLVVSPSGAANLVPVVKQ